MGNSKSKKPFTKEILDDDSEGGVRETFCQHDLKVVAALGKGSFGKVEWTLLGKRSYAMKTMLKARFFRSTDHSILAWNERNFMIECKADPFVIDLTCSFHLENKLFLVCPFYNGGDLLGRMKKCGGMLPISQSRFYIACCLLALDALHEKNICHRDIKPENVFVDEHGYAVLGDLGLATKISSKKFSKTRYWGLCGSYGYRAPEVVRNESCGPAADLYSLGITFYFLTFGGVPWGETKQRLAMELKSGEDSLFFPKTPDPLTKDVVEVLRGLLSVSQSARKTVAEIKEYHAFNDLDWVALASRTLPAPWVPDSLPSQTQLRERANTYQPAKIHEEAKELTEEQSLRFEGFEYACVVTSGPGSVGIQLSPSDTENIEIVPQLPEVPLPATPSSTPPPSPPCTPPVTPPTEYRQLGVARSPAVKPRRVADYGSGKHQRQISVSSSLLASTPDLGNYSYGRAVSKELKLGKTTSQDLASSNPDVGN